MQMMPYVWETHAAREWHFPKNVIILAHPYATRRFEETIYDVIIMNIEKAAVTECTHKVICRTIPPTITATYKHSRRNDVFWDIQNIYALSQRSIAPLMWASL